MGSMMSDDSDERGIIMEGPSDPDAQATVSDFIDYTEYLPSDLVRSLTLIRGLDETYLDAADAVHELTKIYGQLPNLPADSRPKPVVLRKQISEQLGRAMNARESAYAEACRLYDVVDRYFDRLGSIKSKLNALTSTCTAISRDVSASPGAETLPETTQRPRNGRKAGKTPSVPRITLRIDGSRQPAASSTVAGKRGQKGKSQGAATRGGNLAVRDPDSPIASTEQSEEGVELGSSRAAEAAKQLVPLKNKRESKKQKRGMSRRISQPRHSSGNVQMNRIDTSTSNALALLKPPPEDAKIGSEYFPWLRLTEWEMTKLRKKMKKNNVWQPSEIMIHRELALRGRGWEGYRLAKLNAETTGAEFVDCDDIANNYIPGKLVLKSEVSADVSGVEETKLSNRGMKLNEAKKLKRENLAREQAALAAVEAEMAARRLGDIGSTFKSLFSSPAEQNLHNVQSGLLGTSFKANGPIVKDRPKAPKQATRKRKFEEAAALESSQDVESPAAVSLVTAKPSSKKRKLSKSASTSTIHPSGDEPLMESVATAKGRRISAVAGPSAASKVSPRAPSPTDLRRATGPATSKPLPTTTPPTTRATSRPRSATGAPVEATGRDRLRRKSATPAVAKTTPGADQPTGTTAAGRRSKRPAPGPVTSGQDGGAAVSVGRRKAKPAVKKKRDQGQRVGSQPPRTEDLRVDEDGVLEEIDPNEPRYCLCGDVSFGTMICCEDNDCDKEWFHLDCVGLTEVPSRTAKWYCPECRKKLGRAATDGIVRIGGGRR
ncbi:PHD finger domain-containing protein [Histoplasma capsulatum G186AR]|uniref:Chromatin modification-related protein n=1 Tax=Ajellomyces capsulatus TaxID=5037 RepID=A0A8H8D2U1_AJECA|nr:PHD finger domain-containing protein [Histoplasma capsulatum]QSS68396.1 PHD finger domain-containing protein [Histoplasma capsulatum G186AR]